SGERSGDRNSVRRSAGCVGRIGGQLDGLGTACPPAAGPVRIVAAGIQALLVLREAHVASSPRNAGRVRAGTSAGARRGTPARPPVMAYVAQLAGVSHQTVSRVLNDHPNVRP